MCSSWESHGNISALPSCARERGKAKSKLYPAVSVPGIYCENKLHSKGWEIKKQELLLCWKPMVNAMFPTCRGFWDLRWWITTAFSLKDAKISLGNSSPSAMKVIFLQDLNNLNTKSNFQYTNGSTRDTAAHCFALKLPYFRHWFAISWLRFSLIPFDLQVQLYQWLAYCQINCPAPKLSSGIGVMHLKHTINLVLQCSERWYVTENTSQWQRYLRPFPLKMHWWCQLGEGRKNVKKKHNLPLSEAGGWKYGDYRDV